MFLNFNFSTFFIIFIFIYLIFFQTFGSRKDKFNINLNLPCEQLIDPNVMHLKLLYRFNYKSQGENNKKTRSWGKLPSS